MTMLEIAARAIRIERAQERMMQQVQIPPGFAWEGPPPALPLRAVGAVVMDARSQVIANCPNAALADFVAYSANVLNGAHAPA
jgi:hypothetical protein